MKAGALTTLIAVLLISAAGFLPRASAQLIELKDQYSSTINLEDIREDTFKDRGPQIASVWDGYYRLFLNLKNGEQRSFLYLSYAAAQTDFYRLRDAFFSTFFRGRLNRGRKDEGTK